MTAGASKKGDEKRGGKAGKAGRYHHGDLRRALVEASVQCIEEEGVQATTLREVARRAGVSHAAPYRHFADKDALLAAVAQLGFEELVASLTRAVRRESEPRAQLVEAAAGYVGFARRRPAYFEVMFRGGRSHEGGAADASQVAFAGLRSMIERGQVEGALPAGDPADMAQSAWALVHGIAELAVGGRLAVGRPRELAALTRFAADALLAGFASRA